MQLWAHPFFLHRHNLSPKAWAQAGSLSSTTGAVGSGFWASKALAQSSKATER
jgi:hypothetical protein